MTIARLRELLVEATPGRGPTTAFAFVTREQAVFLDAARAALPALLDRLEAAEAVVEAAREVVVHGSGTGEWTAADEVRGEALVYALDDALRHYDEVRRG